MSLNNNNAAIISYSNLDSISFTKSYASPIIAFVSTRILCFVLIIIGSVYYPAETFSPQYSVYMEVMGSDFASNSLFPFVHWDAISYIEIAKFGYLHNPELTQPFNVAFFPLYPCLIKLLILAGIPGTIAGILISNTALLITACMLYKLVATRFSVAAATWTIWLWLSYPLSVFGSVPYAESALALLFVFILESYWRKNLLAGGFFAGLASALKVPGILLAIPILKGFYHREWSKTTLALLLSTTGLSFYMLYLYLMLDDPLIFISVQQHWGRRVGSWNPVEWLSLCFDGLFGEFANIRSFGTIPLSSLAGLCVIAWLPTIWRQQGCLIAIMTLALIGLPLSTGTAYSLGRFCWIILPVFIAAGVSLCTSRLRWAILTVFLLLLARASLQYGGCWTFSPMPTIS